jgi:hypothetical protein
MYVAPWICNLLTDLPAYIWLYTNPYRITIPRPKELFSILFFNLREQINIVETSSGDWWQKDKADPQYSECQYIRQHRLKLALGSGGGSRPSRIFSCSSFQASRRFCLRSFFRSFFVRNTGIYTGFRGSAATTHTSA